MTNRKGFTLIELLVVIAIIAILAAILFPVFAKAREKARQISCLSNLKQMGLGITQYQQDYDERTPGGRTGSGDGRGWAGEIYSYVKSVQVYKCPNDAGADAASSSYGLNVNTTGPDPSCVASGYSSGVCFSPSIYGVGTPLASFNAPAMTVLVFEVANSRYYDVSNEGASYGASASANGLYNPSGYNQTSNYAAATPGDGTLKYATGVLNGLKTNAGCFITVDGRHSGGSNYLFADDHAKWLRPSLVSPGTNAAKETDAQVDEASSGRGTAAGTNGTFSDGKTRPGATFSIQ